MNDRMRAAMLRRADWYDSIGLPRVADAIRGAWAASTSEKTEGEDMNQHATSDFSSITSEERLSSEGQAPSRGGLENSIKEASPRAYTVKPCAEKPADDVQWGVGAVDEDGRAVGGVRWLSDGAWAGLVAAQLGSARVRIVPAELPGRADVVLELVAQALRLWALATLRMLRLGVARASWARVDAWRVALGAALRVVREQAAAAGSERSMAAAAETMRAALEVTRSIRPWTAEGEDLSPDLDRAGIPLGLVAQSIEAAVYAARGDLLEALELVPCRICVRPVALDGLDTYDAAALLVVASMGAELDRVSPSLLARTDELPEVSAKLGLDALAVRIREMFASVTAHGSSIAHDSPSWVSGRWLQVAARSLDALYPGGWTVGLASGEVEP